MKKAITITLSIILSIILITTLVCVIYFNVKIDITKDLDKFFAQSEVTYFSPNIGCAPSVPKYELRSEKAKEIVNKHLKGIKFKHTTGYPIYFGGGVDDIKCGDKYFAISYMVVLNGKQYKLTDELRPIFTAMCDELLEYGTLLPNQNDNLEEIE